MKKFLEKAKYSLYAGWFGISNPWGSDSFTTVEGTVSKAEIAINTAMAFSAFVAVIMIIYGGYTMMIAAGDAEKVDTGSKSVMNGVIGMGIVFVAGMAIKWLVDRLGL